MTNNDTRFVYLRDGKNDVTVAYRYDDDRQAIEFNVARRNKKDQFIKAVGREVAAGRLAKNGGYLVPFAAIESYVEAANDKEVALTAELSELFGDSFEPRLIENPRGYRAVAGFIHALVNPSVQPFDKNSMMVVMTKNASGEHEGIVVARGEGTTEITLD